MKLIRAAITSGATHVCPTNWNSPGGRTLSKILDVNGARVQWSSFNFGGNQVTVQVDNPDLALGGWGLTSGGSLLSFNLEEDGAMPIWSYYAFTTVGTSDIFVAESVIYKRIGEQ